MSRSKQTAAPAGVPAAAAPPVEKAPAAEKPVRETLRRLRAEKGLSIGEIDGRQGLMKRMRWKQKKCGFVPALLLALALVLGGCGAVKWQYRPITDVNDLQGRRVGLLLAWEPDYLLTGRTDMELVRYDSLADMVMALKTNRVDAIAVDTFAWKRMAVGSEGLNRVLPACGSFGAILYFNPDGEALKDDFNAFLAEFKKTEAYRDHLTRLENFDGVNYVDPGIQLTGTGEVLRVAVESEGFPRTFQNAGEDVPTGFDLEALKYFANERNYRMEFTLSTYSDMIIGLQSGLYDVMAGGMSDVYAEEVNDAGMFTCDAFDQVSLYFIEKTQQNIKVAVEELE